MRRAIAELEREGDFQQEAKSMRWRSYGGAPVSLAYRLRYRHRYRQRADWERELADMADRFVIPEIGAPCPTWEPIRLDDEPMPQSGVRT